MATDKIKIVFVIPSLRAGGAERVMSFLALNINKEKFVAHLLVVGDEKEISYGTDGIAATFLNKSKVRYAIPSIINFLHHFRPDIVISAIAHLNTVMALISLFFPKIKFIGRETLVIGKQINNFLSPNYFISRLRPKLLDVIICQSEDMRKDLIINQHFPKKKLVVINNPVTPKFKLKTENTIREIPHFITVGRLTEQKGYFRLLNILANLKKPFHYTIIGDGTQKISIYNKIKELGLGQKVSHIKFTEEIEKYLSASDLYLQGSYAEGFPNALLESCAVGTPVLAFDAPGGINEIVIEGVNGYMAKNEDDFFNKIYLCIKKKWEPILIRDSVMKKYSQEIILAKYEKLFISLVE